MKILRKIEYFEKKKTNENFEKKWKVEKKMKISKKIKTLKKKWKLWNK
mgnify:CR=1 FL=1